MGSQFKLMIDWTMFPDSKMQYGLINHGLAPYFKSLLLDSLKKSDIYVYSFDESLNYVTQTCEMDLYIRYWDIIDNQVSVRYQDLRFQATEGIKTF